MIKPDERTLKAINNIQQYPDWKVIREWIDASAQDALITSVKTYEDTVSKWKQGAAQELLDIQSHFDNVKKALERMDKAKDSMFGITLH